jgi:uncharacterized protein (DUF362 family)
MKQATRKIYVSYGKNYSDMVENLMKTADVASRIPRGAKVALKPNLVVAKKPDSGATTHTEILEGVIRYLRQNGIDDIKIIEGAWVGDSTARGFVTCGYDRLGAAYGVPLVDLKKDKTTDVTTPIGPIAVCNTALETDYLINLPVLKGHCQTVMTCALKNCKGCLPDREKRRFHTLGLVKPIAALASILRPPLTIVDSICGDLNFEEGGTPVQCDRIMLGFDPVEIDTYCCSLLGLSPDEVPYIRLAETFGAGSMAVTPQDIIVLNKPESAGNTGTRTEKLAGRLAAHVQQASACSACFANLVRALYRYREITGKSCTEQLFIGQEFKGRKKGGTGIGQCCSGAARYAAGCPPSADSILSMLLDKQPET